jgi:hypothetical protein
MRYASSCEPEEVLSQEALEERIVEVIQESDKPYVYDLFELTFDRGYDQGWLRGLGTGLIVGASSIGLLAFVVFAR